MLSPDEMVDVVGERDASNLQGTLKRMMAAVELKQRTGDYNLSDGVYLFTVKIPVFRSLGTDTCVQLELGLEDRIREIGWECEVRTDRTRRCVTVYATQKGR